MPLAELDHQLLPRIVFNAVEGLQREIAGGFETVGGHVGAADDIGVGGQGVEDALGKGGGAEAGVVNADRA